MPHITDPAEKLRLLKDNCDEAEDTSYVKPLSQEELDVKRESLADNCIEQARLEEELKEIKTAYKDKIDPIKEDNKVLCHQIKTRQEDATGKLFHFNNHDDGMRYTYDENGELVGTRRLKPEEKQRRMPFIAPAANQ